MIIKQEVAYGVIEAITDLRKGNDLEDFTVIVDGVCVRCHRFILGACSLFFRALFRSGMKEDEENCATLKTVSHPTFTLILSALYMGCDILSPENVIDVWRAAHMLEIGFLVNECEQFIEQNISIDNFEKIYETAKLLDSRTILRTEHKFMTKNFDLIRTSQTLLKLSFSEINALIKTDELVTSSEDNVVESILQWVSYTPPQTSVQGTDNEVKYNMKGLAVQNEDKYQENQLNTIELTEENGVNITHGNKSSETNEVVDKHDDLLNTSDEDTNGKKNVLHDTENQNKVQDKMTSTNEVGIQTLAPVHKQTQTSLLSDGRKQHLLSLISNSRSCLLSPKCLERLLLKPIIIDNPKVRSIVLRAVSYQLQPGYRHGQWPSAAIHRSNSQLKHVLVRAVCGNYHQHPSFRNGSMYAENFFSGDEEFVLPVKASSGKITAFDNELYELNNDGLYVLTDNFWKNILSCHLSDKTLMISMENLIYFLDGSTKDLTSVIPKAKSPALQAHSRFPGEFTIAGAARYRDRIIVFSFNEEDKTETVVHTFDPSNGTWASLENLKGPAEDIISFHNDKNTFLLQTNGNLWKITNDKDGSVTLALCKKAWDFHWKLHGAAIFREKLIIFGGEKPKDKYVCFFLPGSCERAQAWTVKCKICITPIILPSEYLQKKK